MATEAKDADLQHSEIRQHGVSPSSLSDSAEVTGFEADETNLPKGYFYSRFFIGTFFAIGLSLWAGTGAL
jgi:hypothetical protein